MTVDIVSGVLGRADDPAGLGEYLTGEIRAQTGASFAVFAEAQNSDPGCPPDALTVNPPTGRELARSPEVHRLVVCTGFSETLDAEGARSVGATGFVLKPFSQATLGEAVAQALRRGRGVRRGDSLSISHGEAS